MTPFEMFVDAIRHADRALKEMGIDGDMRILLSRDDWTKLANTKDVCQIAWVSSGEPEPLDRGALRVHGHRIEAELLPALEHPENS